MKNRILSIALALSLLAVVFAALPTSAYVDYTGSVKTTDNLGAAKDTYVQGQAVYVSAQVRYQGQLSDQDIRLRLETLTGGTVSAFNDVADLPAVGWYNSTELTGQQLWTGGAPISGDRGAFYVVLYERWSMTEIARTTITILKVGLTIEPAPGVMDVYTPGQELTAKLVTTYTTDMFYVTTVNESGDTVAGMNWTAQIAPSGYWERTFTLGNEMPDGTYRMRVRDSTTNALEYQYTFDVQKFVFQAEADRYYYLPGETAMISIMVIDVSSFDVAVGVTVTYTAHWWNYSANGSTVFESWENGTLSGAFGYHEFLIPTDVAQFENVDIDYWANESAIRSASDSVTLHFGAIGGTVSLDSTSYMPGETVVVELRSLVGGNSLPNASVDLSVWYNGTKIDAYGASGLTTDQYGYVTHTFVLSETAAKGSYVVNAVFSKEGFSITKNAQFQVVWNGWLVVTLGQEYYYGGDTVVADFEPIWNGQVVDVDSVSYRFGTSDGVLLWGNTSATTASFDIPDGYYGFVYVSALAKYSSFEITGFDEAEVRFADLTLTANADEYRPGETVEFSWHILTGVGVTGSLAYQITDDAGTRVASDSLSYAKTGSFEFVVPTENPSTWYTATMWMTTADGGFADAELVVDLVSSYELMIWPGASSYASGAFEAGDMVKLHYKIGTYTNNELPAYLLYVYTSYNPAGMSFLVADSEGVLDVPIPDDVPTASMWIGAEVYDPANPADWLASDGTNVMVSSDLSSWDKSVGGMSAIDFTLLILIVIMLLMLIIVPFMRGRMGGSKPAKSEVPPQPPAP